MTTFTLIRTYSCRKSVGFVYELDGKRCASLALSLDTLKAQLSATEDKMNLPNLTGSSKQITWATELRNKRLTLLTEADAVLPALVTTWPELAAELVEFYTIATDLRTGLENQAVAKYWIDTRNDKRIQGLNNAIPHLERCVRRDEAVTELEKHKIKGSAQDAKMCIWIEDWGN